MAIFDAPVQATEVITSVGGHTFEHGLGTVDVFVELLDGRGQTVVVPYSTWTEDTVRVEVPAGTSLPATLRVVG